MEQWFMDNWMWLVIILGTEILPFLPTKVNGYVQAVMNVIGLLAKKTGKSVGVFALIVFSATTVYGGYVVIKETGDYTIQKDSVILYEVAPVKAATPVVNPPVVEPDPPVVPPVAPPTDVPPPVVDEPPVVVPDVPPVVVPPTDVPPPAADEPPIIVPDVPPVVEPPIIVPDTPPVAEPPVSAIPVPPAQKPFVVEATPEGKMIPGGNYPTPYVITVSGKYWVGGDMNCDSSCIVTKNGGIEINLNGNELVYNQVSPGSGVKHEVWNKNNVTIHNGKITQGAAMSEGDVYGEGNNPIQIRPYSLGGLKVQNTILTYGGRDVNGIVACSTGALIEYNTLNDVWGFGMVKNRHQGVSAISTAAHGGCENNVVRFNVINGARQIGVRTGPNSQVYGNIIRVKSKATNSSGVSAGVGSKIFENWIYGEGEHPIGVFATSWNDNGQDIYRNYIESRVTYLGEEYGGDPACRTGAKKCGNYAVGVRATWGGKNLRIYDNVIKVFANSRFQGFYAPTGEPVVIDAKARGLMLGAEAGHTMDVYGNHITAIDETNGQGVAHAAAFTANEGALIKFHNNIAESTNTIIAASDYYGKCLGYPMVYNNTLRQLGNNANALTFEAAWEGYSDATLRVGQNAYEGGAGTEKTKIWPEKRGVKNFYFGRVVEGVPAQFTTPFDGTGWAFDYRLYNSGGKLMKELFTPIHLLLVN